MDLTGRELGLDDKKIVFESWDQSTPSFFATTVLFAVASSDSHHVPSRATQKWY